MKLEQKDDFKPIVITLETREEALAFAHICDSYNGQKIATKAAVELALIVSNWFSNEAHL